MIEVPRQDPPACSAHRLNDPPLPISIDVETPASADIPLCFPECNR